MLDIIQKKVKDFTGIEMDASQSVFLTKRFGSQHTTTEAYESYMPKKKVDIWFLASGVTAR